MSSTVTPRSFRPAYAQPATHLVDLPRRKDGGHRLEPSVSHVEPFLRSCAGCMPAALHYLDDQHVLALSGRGDGVFARRAAGSSGLCIRWLRPARRRRTSRRIRARCHEIVLLPVFATYFVEPPPFP